MKPHAAAKSSEWLRCWSFVTVPGHIVPPRDPDDDDEDADEDEEDQDEDRDPAVIREPNE